MEYHHDLEWLRYTVLNYVSHQIHVADGRNVNNSWDNSSVNDSVHREFRYFLFLSYFGLLSRMKMYYTVLISTVLVGTASSLLLTHEQSSWRRVDAKTMPETVAPSVVDKQRGKCHGNGGKNLCQHLQMHYINMNKINCN